MKKKLSSIATNLSGRTKIALVICLLAISVITAGVIFNWDRLSGGSSAKASPVLQGEEDSNPNSIQPYKGASDYVAPLSAEEQYQLDHMPAANQPGMGGGASGAYSYPVIGGHTYNYKTHTWTCPVVSCAANECEIDATGCMSKKAVNPTTPAPTGCQQCDSNIVCSCNCS